MYNTRSSPALQNPPIILDPSILNPMQRDLSKLRYTLLLLRATIGQTCKLTCHAASYPRTPRHPHACAYTYIMYLAMPSRRGDKNKFRAARARKIGAQNIISRPPLALFRSAKLVLSLLPSRYVYDRARLHGRAYRSARLRETGTAAVYKRHKKSEMISSLLLFCFTQHFVTIFRYLCNEYCNYNLSGSLADIFF